MITWSFKNWLDENGTHIALAGTYQKFSGLTIEPLPGNAGFSDIHHTPPPQTINELIYR
jgi:hypothetical protein